MSSRLLVVNSNTSVSATQRIAAGCAGYVRPMTEVSYVNVEAGPQGIDTPLDRAISGLGTARAIALHRHTFDAFVVACGMDPGLDAARQVTDKPVVGIAEAGMLMACTLGARFSVLVPMRSSTAPMQDLVGHYGLTSRLASIVPLEMATSELIDGPGALRARVLEAARTAHERDLAEVVVMTGSVMVGAVYPRVSTHHTRIEVKTIFLEPGGAWRISRQSTSCVSCTSWPTLPWR
jgi:allantoin racemase